MLDGQVILQGIRSPVAEVLADAGNAETASAKAVRVAGGKLVGIVEKPSVAVNGLEAAHERWVCAGGAVRHEDVVTVVKLTEPCADRPLRRSCGIPSHTQPGRDAAMIVVLYSPVGTGQSARSRRTGIRQEARRVVQTVAGRVAERGVKSRLVKNGEFVIRLVGIRQIGIASTQVESQAAAKLYVVVEIKFSVFPAALFLEDDILFAPIDRLVLQNPIGKTIVGGDVRQVRAPWICDLLAAIVTAWSKGHALFLGEVVWSLLFRL